jgi:hypothetical protein
LSERPKSVELVAMKALILAVGIIGAAWTTAAEIRWTARGTVSSVSGSGFSGTSAVANAPAEFEMAYDSNMLTTPRSFISFGAAVAGNAWFYGNANLRITIRINGQTWSGQLPIIPSGTSIMESSCWDGGGNPDVFKVTLDSARGGVFPDFPQAGNETSLALGVEFRDSTSPAELFQVHTLPDSLTSVCAMTTATASITSGASIISLTIDPATVNVSLPQVPATIAKTETGIQLSWNTELGKTYRIEGSSDMKCWSYESEFPGTGGTIQESLTPFETYQQRFYRIAEY